MAEPAPQGVQRLEATVRGRVQGVGYRFFVLREATALGLVGWVANDQDATVRCVAEGPVDALRQLLAALEEGPPGARVSRVDHVWSSTRGSLRGFEIRSGHHPGD